MIIGECREYAELLTLLRSYRPAIDHVADLPPSLLPPSPIKNIGRVSLGAILGVLGLKLVVEVDQEQFERIRHRLTKRKNARAAGPGIAARRRRSWFQNSPEKARKLRVPQLAIQSP